MSNVRHIKFLSRFKKVKNKKDNYDVIHERKDFGEILYRNCTRKKALDYMNTMMKKAMALNWPVSICGRGEELDLHINGEACFKLRPAQVQL